ncbi:origin recognition complex subunit 3 N-terminus-domain-containing protein [Amanita rubescens]|nr:origin recognition complex subunit 3 N-terminus-domain-containing protein [Amanita rubescens]
MDNSSILCIPFNEEADDSDDNYMRLLTQDYETLDEVRLRLDAYHKSWHKCLHRLLSSIRSQHEPIVHDVVCHIQNSYEEKAIQTPYDELPVICIQSSLSGTSILDDICSSLDENEDTLVPLVLQVHLYASDCPSVMVGMKTIITSLTERVDVLEPVKRKPSTSVANFDIAMLVAWYTALCNTSKNAAKPLIAIVMRDFEQFDPSIMQDIFYLFSQQVSKLRSVFILSLSSPVSPSFFHLAYPRSTLSLLCMDTFVAPSGLYVLEKAFQQTFFDVEFSPDITLGPTALEQIFHYIKRNNISLDAFLTSIQLIHLRHFMLNPLSLLVHQTPPIASFSSSLCDKVRNRLPLIPNKDGRKSPTKRRSQKATDMTVISSIIDQTREEFSSQSLRMRLGFGLVRLVYDVIQGQDFGDRRAPPKFGLLDMMLDALGGSLYKYAQRLGQYIRHLDECQLTALLDQLHELFEHPPLLKDQKKARQEVSNFLSLVVDKEKPLEQIARDVCEWMEEYLECVSSLTNHLDELPFWEIWYTGNAPFPSEFLNPSIRATILSGLLRPHDYYLYPNATAQDKAHEIWELPDISILFTRYTESGKMINVYDWFESFQLALERQREHLKEQDNGKKRKSLSPKKRGKGKAAVEQPEDEQDEEQWRLEVQARFIRALHELDYLGFIKHTGRKADHVLRTVFDVGD